MGYTVEEIIDRVKLSTLAPISQNTFDDTKIIYFANEELFTKIVPLIKGVREDFFVTSKISAYTVDKSRYPIPERCVGNSLKDVFHIPSGNILTNKYPLPRGEIHNTPLVTGSGEPVVYQVHGDELVFIPTPNRTTASYEVFYFKRPSSLIATTSCAKITAISTVSGTTTFTVNTDLTGSLSVGSLVDFLSAKSPYMTWADDVAITAITATTIAVTTTDIDDEVGAVEPIVNDYICPAQYSNIPMVPSEFHPMLVEMVSARILKALGDVNKLQAVLANIRELETSALKLIAHRVEDSPQVVYDRSSFVNLLTGEGFRGRSSY